MIARTFGRFPVQEGGARPTCPGPPATRNYDFDSRVEDHPAAASPLGPGDHHEAIAGPDRAPESDLLHAAEAGVAVGDEVDDVAIEAAELGRRLAHQDPRHQGG